jgi:hypothetical protein
MGLARILLTKLLATHGKFKQDRVIVTSGEDEVAYCTAMIM